METIVKTNDMSVIAFIEALLREAGIDYLILDQHMSVLEGSVGMIPRRILVGANAVDAARDVLTNADLGHELEPVDRA
ncbi:MAG: DUF2007 domain-containing protein [Rhizobiales bacterium]|nr:DUF2007 domain-containing protein [Hyphomicrobiales bacterium]